jgi:hypothetical protein
LAKPSVHLPHEIGAKNFKIQKNKNKNKNKFFLKIILLLLLLFKFLFKTLLVNFLKARFYTYWLLKQVNQLDIT